MEFTSMPNITIYHNPRCTKSRQTLALLEEQGVEPVIVEYLKHPPDAGQLASIVKKLGTSPRELVRSKEFKELSVAEPTSDAGWLELMAKNPRIIQRPIVVCGDQAALGRPPERVLEIL